jgi:hypothetical protein
MAGRIYSGFGIPKKLKKAIEGTENIDINIKILAMFSAGIIIIFISQKLNELILARNVPEMGVYFNHVYTAGLSSGDLLALLTSSHKVDGDESKMDFRTVGVMRHHRSPV